MSIMLEINSSQINKELLIKNIAFLYNINYSLDCSLLKRSNSDIYELSTKNNRYIVKIFPINFKKEKIEFLIDFIIQLLDNYKHISKPIKSLSGKYITNIILPESNRFLTITSYAKGIEQKYTTKGDSYRYGKYIALLHLKSDLVKKNKNDKNNFNIKEIFNNSFLQIKKFLLLKKYYKEFRYFEYFGNKIKLIIDNLDTKDLNYGFCHNDLHGGNAHLYNDSLEFFDFDNCGFGLRAYDIAVFKWSTIIGKRENHWKSFLKGYKSYYNLSNKDLEICSFLVFIRDIWVFAQDIEKTKYLGDEYINKYYINKRIEFLQQINKTLNIYQ